MTLPEDVYHDVLPRFSPVFAALDRIMAEVRRGADSPPRKSRRVAKQPLDALAIARLGDDVRRERYGLWRSALDAVGHSGEEPAVRMARLALSQPDGEVRRRGCEYLAAHPDPAHEVFLASLLADPDQAVAVAAIRPSQRREKCGSVAENPFGFWQRESATRDGDCSVPSSRL